MEWKDSYNIGVPLIDNQHKELCKRVNNFKEALSSEHISKEMGGTIKFLVDYTKHHFSAEEEIMRDSDDPNLDYHMELHRNLIHEITVILVKLRTGKEVNASKLSDLLNEWLINHILTEDIKIAEFIQKKEKHPVSDETHLAEDHTFNLIRRMKKIKSLYDTELISESDFIAKKEALLEDYCQVGSETEYKSLEKKQNMISFLIKKELITAEEEKKYNGLLFKNFDLTKLLGDIPKIEDKLKYLKSSYKDKLISEEEFEKHKMLLLDDV